MIHTYYQQNPYEVEPLLPEADRAVAKGLGFFAKILFIFGALVTLILYLPSLIIYLNPGRLDISKLLGETKSPSKPVITTIKKSDYQPRFDSRLPVENSLVIKSLGINTRINEAQMGDYEDALKKGVWRVPDYGTPFNRQNPTILAAHRYGYLRWSVPYRLKNSFFSLPKLEEGDVIEITWRQRKYIYEVYSTGKGEEIDDYSADLILYTCESLNSPIRIFKYARLLEV